MRTLYNDYWIFIYKICIISFKWKEQMKESIQPKWAWANSYALGSLWMLFSRHRSNNPAKAYRVLVSIMFHAFSNINNWKILHISFKMKLINVSESSGSMDQPLAMFENTIDQSFNIKSVIRFQQRIKYLVDFAVNKFCRFLQKKHMTFVNNIFLTLSTILINTSIHWMAYTT